MRLAAHELYAPLYAAHELVPRASLVRLVPYLGHGSWLRMGAARGGVCGALKGISRGAQGARSVVESVVLEGVGTLRVVSGWGGRMDARAATRFARIP